MATTPTLVKRALREALASYLQTALVGQFSGIVCSGEWPTPGKALPPLAVTVTTPASPITTFHPTVPHAVTNAVSGKADVVYSFGHVEQGMQIDIWTTFREVRDSVAEALYLAINVPPAVSLGLSALPNWGHRGGLVLSLPLLYGIHADFQFPDAPDTTETSELAQGGEWRATWQGTASLETVNQENVPMMTKLIVDLTAVDPLEGA